MLAKKMMIVVIVYALPTGKAHAREWASDVVTYLGRLRDEVEAPMAIWRMANAGCYPLDEGRNAQCKMDD